MIAKRPNWISIIEASYDLQGSDAEWLSRLLDRAAPLLNGEAGPMAWTFHYTPTSFKLGDLSHRTSKALVAIAHLSHALGSEASLDLTCRSRVAIETASAPIFPRLPVMRRIPIRPVVGHLMDLLVINCLGGTGVGVSIGVLVKTASEPTLDERKRWPQVAAHIGAAMRLRTMLRELSLENMPVEAVLDSGGKIHDLRGPASVEAREKLREGVRRIERSRTVAGREDADEALRNWEGLVRGRWSLVDRFDSDGRRFVVAMKNDPVYRDPRGLTERERQVAEFVGLGKSSKDIAYTLGVSDAAVTNCTARAQEKLGLNSRAELVAFFAQDGLRRRLAEIAIADEKLLVGAYPLIEERSVASLSGAERDVVAHLVAGSTNGDIAQRRGSSEHTVANQVQSIFRKMGVRSRAELIVRLRTVA